jgi:hypothetical protein
VFVAEVTAESTAGVCRRKSRENPASAENNAEGLQEARKVLSPDLGNPRQFLPGFGVYQLRKLALVEGNSEMKDATAHALSPGGAESEQDRNRKFLRVLMNGATNSAVSAGFSSRGY